MSLRTPQMKNRMYIFPELLDDRVENKSHAARFFSYLARILDLNLYKTSSMGSPPYARPTLVAVILYAMYRGYFEAEGIVRFAQDSIGAQWILNGMKMPSYKTVARTIDALLDGLDGLSEKEIQAFVRADAQQVHRALEKSHQEFLKARQEQIFSIDAQETVKETAPDPVKLKAGLQTMGNIEDGKQEEALEILNIIAFADSRVARMEAAKKELEVRWKAANGNKKIPEKQQINFTDSDSCIMKTKHQGVQQCYNHFAIVDAKANIILGPHSSNNACDQLGLIPTIENTEKLYGSLEGYRLAGDTGFFSAANLIYAEGCGIDFYALYPEAKSPYAKDKFKYDEAKDAYLCPCGNILSAESQSEDRSKCLYSNESACKTCKNSNECTKAKDGIRRIERDMANDKVREKAKEKAQSAEGHEILRLRKTIPEPVWGNIKVQDGFTQMHYRGDEKATLEFMLHCMVQNIRKLLKVYFHSSSWQEVIHRAGGIGENYQQAG